VLRAATKTELELPPPLGLPQPVKPAPELLGEVLLETGRPRDAIQAFERALRRNPNRSLAVLGLARAHAALGEIDASRRHYRELLANFNQADADLPELEEARRALENPSRPTARYLLALLGVMAIALAAALTVARSRRRPQGAARGPRGKKAKR